MAETARHIVHEIYSDVIFELAEETGRLDEVLSDLQAVGKVLRAEPEFFSLLASANLSETEKVAIIRRIFAGRVCPLVLDFLCVLARRNRLTFLNGIAGRYEDRYDSVRNRKRVVVTLAKEPTEAQLETLKEEIRRAVQAEVKLTVKVDPEILGGIIIQKGDQRIDNSVKNILDRTVNVILEYGRNRPKPAAPESSK
jgi:F-type H+-transporting ATPase subunit delta